MDDQNKSVNDRWAAGAASEPRQAADRGYVGERGYAADERPGAHPEEQTTAIRSEIEHTRAEMTETIDAIQDRLRPSNVVSRAAGNVRDATVGRMRHFARGPNDEVPRRAADWYYGTSVMDRVRENPVPAALAAVSLAWLAFGKRPSRDYEGPPYGGSYGYDSGQYGARFPAGTTDLSSAFDERREQVASAAGEALTHARDLTSEAGERVREMTSHAGERMQSARWQTQRRMQRLTHENTIVAGAVAAAVGVAIGLALPDTERENALMGEARDSVVNRAKEAARGAAERVQDTAQQVQRVASSAIAGTDRNRTNPARPGPDNP